MKIKKGSCLCGAVKYRVKLDKLPLVYNCHCIDCRKKTGGAFVTVIQLRDQALDINKDNLASFKHPGYSKKNLHKFCCKICASPIYSYVEKFEKIFLYAGSLEEINDIISSKNINFESSHFPFITIENSGNKI
tara:strand:+ start:3075 stop:3473 length:399 start_codon:yes stop_codon:yes gene_type:complete